MAEKNSTDVIPELSNVEDLSADDLINAAYPDLKRMARRQLRKESGQAFQTTELVNEAVIRWLNGRQSAHSALAWMAIMAKVMRNVLVDEARSRHAQKRGNNPQKITININTEFADEASSAFEILDLESALVQLHALDARKAEVIECHYFGGMKVKEMATHFAVGEATIKRDLITARAWIGSQINP
ncbi:ECF-type sigma factor [Marinicella litoralis]|uniref:RNA polymerase sigma factor (TIGR02999 family) n=1 Tax=Marinicella litoralis TaxID=644220 RepID=A0A4R6XJ32_9GAMM|nr:ECF-type sigma factor [Marinicella litoralis]TDR17407.1 RNA polymerase sigma factor (TIGR02999 family) [Marinicella litoralis]